MKKLTITVFVAIILSVFFAPVSATSNTYALDELDLELIIPAGYEVITRDTSASSEIFDRIGISGATLIEHFHTNGIYLNAIPTNGASEEIVVTMTEIQIADFSSLSDTSLKVLASGLVDGYTDYGVTVSKYDIYQHSQTKFIRLYFSDTSNIVHGLQYYTVCNSKAMNFTMRSYDGEVSTTQEQAIKQIVDSIKYDTAPLTPLHTAHSDAFLYTDTDTGVTFTVPANWHEGELTKERDYIDTKFMSSEEDGLTILYGSTDFWDMMSISDRTGYTRSDFDNSAFALSDISEVLGVPVSQISKIEYNGIEYFQATDTVSSEIYGHEFSVKMTCVLRYENGVQFWFQFMGAKDNPYFSDFEKLLTSVYYPNESKIDKGDTITEMSDSSSSEISVGVIWIVVALLIGAIVVIGVVVNKQDDIISQSTVTTPTCEDSQMPVITIKCPSCSKEVPPDSQFCHICGAKLK